MKKVLLFSALCLGLCACAKEAPVEKQEMNDAAAQEMLVTDTVEAEVTPTAVVTEETVTATPVTPAAETTPATK